VRHVATDYRPKTSEHYYGEEFDCDVRSVNGQRFVTEARFEQFGRDLKDSLIKEISTAVVNELRASTVKDQPTTSNVSKKENSWRKPPAMTGHNASGPRFQRRPDWNGPPRQIYGDCFNCNSPGHSARDCPLKSAGENKSNNKDVPAENAAKPKSEN
jgi:hypothetical protein